MSSNDYTATTGGTLKLKGAIPKGSKSHKKKRLKPALPSSSNPSVLVQGGSTWKEVEHQDKCLGEEAANKEERLEVDKEEKNEEEQVMMPRLGKTDAEIRHEDRRRRKLHERLKREGIKTHKERVEELNRYLSNLSEHHDMPRIGPG